MLRISHATQPYAWGSRTAIQDLFGPAATAIVAEAWMGAHASAPSLVLGDGQHGLDHVIASDAEGALGQDVVARFGPVLPYLLKVIAADRPLSLQVHPQIERARKGYAEEEAAGIPLDAPHRNYRDTNHKPELVYALTRFDALCGFRAPRRAAELLGGLDAPLARELHAALLANPTPDGIRAAFTLLLEPATRPSAEAVREVADACAQRLASGSPSPRADRNVELLQDAYPGDPGVVISLLLNPVTLLPGDAMFMPAGGVHAYLRGVGVEIMANSDNVLRAGLTPKHIDVPEVLRNVDYVAAPPIRIAGLPRRRGSSTHRSTTSSCPSRRSVTTPCTRCPVVGHASCSASTARSRSPLPTARRSRWSVGRSPSSRRGTAIAGGGGGCWSRPTCPDSGAPSYGGPTSPR